MSIYGNLTNRRMHHIKLAVDLFESFNLVVQGTTNCVHKKFHLCLRLTLINTLDEVLVII